VICEGLCTQHRARAAPAVGGAPTTVLLVLFLHHGYVECTAPVLCGAHGQDPNPEDPLNKDAAQKLKDNPSSFENYVQRSIKYGVQIDGTYFPACT
jgi:hypothetical protein